MAGRPKPSELWRIGEPCIREVRHYSGAFVKLEPDTVAAIGSRWVTLVSGGRGRPYRFDAWTRLLDMGEYTSNERVWKTEAEFEARQATNVAWKALRERMGGRWDAPIGLAAEPLTTCLAAINSVAGNDE